MQEEEGARNKSGLVWGAKTPGKHLESPMDKQKLQNSPQEVKGVSGFSKLYAMTRMTGQNRKHILCLVFMTFINTAIGLSPFWKEAGYHLKTSMFPTASEKFCIARGNTLLT